MCNAWLTGARPPVGVDPHRIYPNNNDDERAYPLHSDVICDVRGCCDISPLNFLAVTGLRGYNAE